jgi:glycosyltransferase involved in cell wall biosynthesis
VTISNENFSTLRRISNIRPVLESDCKISFETSLFFSIDDRSVLDGGLRTTACYKNGGNDNPLLTVITVVFNDVSSIEATIKSVLEQSYDNVEYIVIDGGSTDGTLDVICRYDNALDYWISSRDEGIYCAFNRGITLATGGVVGILNSGDLYYPQTLQVVVDLYKKHKGELIITGGMDKILENGDILTRSVTHKDLDNLNKLMTINHPSTFVSLDVYKKYGLFDPKYFIPGDYDFLKRVIKSGVNCLLIEDNLSLMSYGGVSDKFCFKWFMLDQIRLIIKFPEDAIYVLYFSTRRIVKVLMLYLKKTIRESIPFINFNK